MTIFARFGDACEIINQWPVIQKAISLTQDQWKCSVQNCKDVDKDV